MDFIPAAGLKSKHIVSVPAVDRHRIQPSIGCNYQHSVLGLQDFSQCASFSC